MSLEVINIGTGNAGDGDSLREAMCKVNRNFSDSYRELVSETRTYYVGPLGNDENNGRTTAAPFATIQKAIDVVCDGIVVTGGVGIFIELMDGTHNTPGLSIGSIDGIGMLTIKGNSSNPALTVVNCTSGTAAFSCYMGRVRIQDLEVRLAAGVAQYGQCISAIYGAAVSVANIRFGPYASVAPRVLTVDGFGAIQQEGPLYFLGGANIVLLSAHLGLITTRNGVTASFLSPATADAFAYGYGSGQLRDYGALGAWGTGTGGTATSSLILYQTSVAAMSAATSGQTYPGPSNWSLYSGSVAYGGI